MEEPQITQDNVGSRDHRFMEVEPNCKILQKISVSIFGLLYSNLGHHIKFKRFLNGASWT